MCFDWKGAHLQGARRMLDFAIASSPKDHSGGFSDGINRMAVLVRSFAISRVESLPGLEVGFSALYSFRSSKMQILNFFAKASRICLSKA